MGVTDTGVRWPEPTGPVAQGALDMRKLAEDQTARGPALGLTGTVPGVTLPAGGGTLGAASGTLPAAPYPRLVHVIFMGTLSAATTWVSFNLLVAGVDRGGVRASGTQTSHFLHYFDVVPANTARPYQVNITSSAGATLYGSGGLSYLVARVLGATTSPPGAAADADQPNQDLVDPDAT